MRWPGTTITLDAAADSIRDSESRSPAGQHMQWTMLLVRTSLWLDMCKYNARQAARHGTAWPGSQIRRRNWNTADERASTNARTCELEPHEHASTCRLPLSQPRQLLLCCCCRHCCLPCVLCLQPLDKGLKARPTPRLGQQLMKHHLQRHKECNV